MAEMQLKGVPEAKLGWEEDMSGGGQLLLPLLFAPFENTNTNVKLSHSFFNFAATVRRISFIVKTENLTRKYPRMGNLTRKCLAESRQLGVPSKSFYRRNYVVSKFPSSQKTREEILFYKTRNYHMSATFAFWGEDKKTQILMRLTFSLLL